MEKSTNEETNILETIEIPEGSSMPETLLRHLIEMYQDRWSELNDKHEIQYQLTCTTHKIATQEGNKDIAYLRLDRGIREKGGDDNSWDHKLIHQELYRFRNMQERVSSTSRWKEQLFMNMLGRLVTAGLEYAELLQRLKQAEINEKAVVDKVEASNLIVIDQMPTPLQQQDLEYKEWLRKEREKEGLTL